MTKTASTEQCSHCKGEVETLGRGRAGEIKRCRSCGREPNAARATTLPPALPVASQNGNGRPSAGRRCTVDGCPGTIDDSGRCACCARRAAFIEQRAPKRKCTICEGTITGHGGRQVCDACKAAAKRAKVVLRPRKAK